MSEVTKPDRLHTHGHHICCMYWRQFTTRSFTAADLQPSVGHYRHRTASQSPPPMHRSNAVLVVTVS